METDHPRHSPTEPAPRRRLNCLLLEDDPGFACLIQEVLGEEGFLVKHSGTVGGARELWQRGEYDLVVLDNHLPDGKGFDFYLEIAAAKPAQTAIVLTGLPELAHAVELTRRGLFDYLSKPVDREAFVASIRRARTRLERLGSHPAGDHTLVAASSAMREVQTALQQAAAHATATVLFTGETGSGKDAAARELHRLTHARETADTPFIAVNCAAVPAEMFESELFGAERGAYTGADRTREGLAAAARRGTLFLDEIGEVPLPLQAKLLRFLEAREYRPLGATASRPFLARLIAATNRSLHDEVAAGRFREDLLYRLDVFTIPLPPLRDRRADVPALAETLLARIAERYRRPAPRLLDADTEALMAYPFPGNVRELRNLLERSLLRTPADAAHLALDRAWLQRTSSPAASQPTPAVVPPQPPPRPPAPPTGATETAATAGTRALPPLEAGEYHAIREALEASQGGIRRAAVRLGITHQALLRRLEKWPELRQAGRPAPTP